VKFRRQHPVNRFIVDFYCPDADLVIEVDGAVHDSTREQDRARQEVLESLGLRVLRFTNDEVLGDFENVIKTILSAVDHGSVEASPSPRTGRGTEGEGLP
jgi:very-short-patch-repair endonuclease